VKIVVTGAESTGKTTLASDLAKYYHTTFVTEFARDYLVCQGGVYGYRDLLIIAKGQHDAILRAQDLRPNPIIVDTDLLTIKIWSEYKYGKCARWIEEALQKYKPDLYLLCTPDIPWEEDPLRENPYDREELDAIYVKEINNLKVPYIRLSGSRSERVQTAIIKIESIKSQY